MIRRHNVKLFRARLRIVGATCVSLAVLLVGINPGFATRPLYYCSRRNNEAFRKPRRFAIKTTIMKHSTFRSSFAITVALCLACNQKPPATNDPSAAATVNNNTETISPSADDEAAQPPAQSQPDQRWDGTVQQWGAMREVLALGKTHSRVRLADVIEKPHAFGVGAVAGLMGEVTILNGKAFVAQLEGEFVTSAVQQGHEATLLAAAYVPAWQSLAIESALDSDQLMVFIKSQAQQNNINTDEPFPFLIEGNLSVSAHIINGNCPRAGGEEPIRFECKDRAGTIVGIYAENAAGTLTHHGDVSHMHVVFENESAQSGHVDDVVVMQGAMLKIPKQ